MTGFASSCDAGASGAGGRTLDAGGNVAIAAEYAGMLVVRLADVELVQAAPVHLTTILLAFAGALGGGLLAGVAGGWRAARLAPASALRDLV